jgi:predicted metal-dependent hydrolase
MIEYTVQTHPRARNLKIKILPDGSVVVVKPKYGFFFKSVEQFIKENSAWIERNQQKILAHKKPASSQKNEIVVFGKTYKKVIDFSAGKKIGIHIIGEELHINPVSDSPASIKKALETFLKTTAEKYIVPRTHQLAKQMGIQFGNITLRSQKTRWGSCSSAGNLNFNWQLVHSPPAVIDYVIVHELAHRKQMNHSDKFWAIVRQYDPEHQKHRGWLKRQGMDLE